MKSSSKTVIREMHIHDMPRIIEIAKSLHKESNFCDIPFCDEKVRMQLVKAINSPAHYTVVFERNDNLVGGFWAVLQEFYFSRSLLASDMALFVEEDKRGLFPIHRVIVHFRSWAKEHGVHRISVSQSTGIETERFSQLFSRMGFELAGTNYFQTLIPNSAQPG